jgi:hypothetical protein
MRDNPEDLLRILLDGSGRKNCNTFQFATANRVR